MTHPDLNRTDQFNHGNGTDHYHHQRYYNRNRTAEQTFSQLFFPTKTCVCLRNVSFPGLRSIFDVANTPEKGSAGSTSWPCKPTQTGFELIAEPCSHTLDLNQPSRSMTLCRRLRLVGSFCGCLRIRRKLCSTSRRRLWPCESCWRTILTYNREAGAIILKIAYGYAIEPHEQDPLVHISKLALEQFSIAATPGAWLVDILPVCVLPYTFTLTSTR